MTARGLNANPIEQDMSVENASEASNRVSVGNVTEMATRYSINSDRLLGFALATGYEEIQFTTCDHWKCKNGGIARDQFILMKLSEGLVNPEDQVYCRRLILARVTESTPTSVEREIQGTVFQMHKMQPIVDPITKQELQWSALKVSILGTFYDDYDGRTGRSWARSNASFLYDAQQAANRE